MMALADEGEYGAVSALAQAFGISRQTIYNYRERGREALDHAFPAEEEQDAGDGILLRVTEADFARAMIALRVVAPASFRDIVALLPVLYGRSRSYGKIWNVVAEAERRAAQFNASVDLSRIDHVALDEMFSQGSPVFGGIDLDTQFLFQLEVHGNRTGEEWAESLGRMRDGQGLGPISVVKDAGAGLAKGVGLCWPAVEENDDLFHAVLLMGQERFHLERRAYATIDKEYELEAKRDKAKTESKRRSIGQYWRKAREDCRRAIERFDRFEELRREAQAVLELTDPGDGRLRTSAEVVETLTRVSREMATIGGQRVRKVASYLKNRAPGLGRYLDRLGEELRSVTRRAGGRRVVEAAVRTYQAALAATRRGPAWRIKAQQQELLAALDHLLRVIRHDDRRLQRVLTTVVPVLERRHRASSAIENLNSVLRPYLVVQKHAGQGFLNLFRFYWNTRKREWGRHKGTSAYEQLTGESCDDWLTLLGYPPGGVQAVAA